MKTSNKLLLTALIVLLCSLAAYNMVVKSAYETGAYKDPLGNHVQLGFEGFDEVDVNATNMLRVKIEAGDAFAVYQQKDTEELIQVTQEGNRLKVDLVLPDEKTALGGFRTSFHVVIRTPAVKSIRANAVHTAAGKPTTTRHKLYAPNYFGLLIEGFRQEHLQLELDNGSHVQLAGNQIGTLQATTGRSAGSEPLLQLLPNNKLQQTDLNIRNGSYLELQNVPVPQLRYTFSDSAHVSLSGASLASFRQ
jgi:hypothetical protein